jgi:hypothetical protein
MIFTSAETGQHSNDEKRGDESSLVKNKPTASIASSGPERRTKDHCYTEAHAIQRCKNKPTAQMLF